MYKNVSFVVIWAGQVVSIFGSALSEFALGVWLYQQTGSASNFALVALCTVLPQLLVSPLAGVLVDRYRRRVMMIVADSGAAVCTLLAVWLFASGQMQVGYIYLLTALSAMFNALQWPAYSALVAGAVSRADLGKANGMIQLGQGLAEVLAPALAGALVMAIQVQGVLLIDLATFGVAVLALALARLPETTPSAAPDVQTGGWLGELRVGWGALRARPDLLGLLRFQALFAFLWALFGVLVTPMVLGFATPQGLGLAMTVAGSGLLCGSLLMSVWGGPRRRMFGLLLFELLSSAAFCLMGLRPDLALVASAAFVAHFTLAFVSSLTEALWQGNVDAAVRGRVFALIQTAVKAARLLAFVIAGGLADRLLVPLLLPGGALAGSLGLWLGVGPGRGIAALLVLIGLVKAVAVLGVYRARASRRLAEV